MKDFLKAFLGKAYPGNPVVNKFPVSVKGIICIENRILLLKNERDEWELPGGKLELGETPAQCLAREILEEVNLKVAVDSIVDVWVYSIRKGVNVLIITYRCSLVAAGKVIISKEHQEYGLFSSAEIPNLNLPEGYKNSIRLCTARNGYS